MTRSEAEAASSASGRPINPVPRQYTGFKRAAGCPFHHENQCTIYDHRPAGCRGYVCNGGENAFEQHPEFVEFMTPIFQAITEPVADVRDWFPEPISDSLDRHERIALQFSGGKDSIAILEIMRPYWNRLTVYWLNTGDPFPEVVKVVDKVRAMVPRFVEIDGGRDAVFEQYGLPSDVVPYSSSDVSHQMGVGETVKLQDRFSCCSRVVMQPVHQRMIDDGITLIIRGQRVSENFKGKLRSGDMLDGFEFLYPIEDWSTENVFDYIQSCGWEVPRYYTEGMPHSGDCLVCTAWVGDGRGAYLKKHYPERFEEYREKLGIVANAASGSVRNLIHEIGVCGIQLEG
jgi:phosphoadenosine phosphosulfate reductase